MEDITAICIFLQDEEYYCVQVIIMEGKRIWSGQDLARDCPEDATLSRSMTDASNISNLMDIAQELAFKGKKIQWENIEVSNWVDMEQEETKAIERTKIG